jgi:DNA-binding response OmpR family regulator
LKIGGCMAQSVVLLAKDPQTAQSLAGGLRSHFHAVYITRSREELRDKVAKNRPEAVVLDIEGSRLTDVENLHRDFPALLIVCTHRIPDEEMWMAALEAGASDVCADDDAGNVLTSVLRSMAVSRGAAA